VAFLFSGQGQQLAGMGRGLYRRFPVFRDAFDRCAAAFADAAGDAPPLAQIVFGDDPGLLDRAEYLQPALFAVSLATALLWRSFGVEPAALLGHSLGEITAAAVAGCFDPAAGMALVAARGRLGAGIDVPGGAGRPARRLAARPAEHRRAERTGQLGRLRAGGLGQGGHGAADGWRYPNAEAADAAGLPLRADG
jgi:acyl transferase domain-containing protein